MCPLAASKGEDPVNIENRIENFIDSLYYHPLDVPDADIPGTLTSGRIRSTSLVVFMVVRLRTHEGHSVALADVANTHDVAGSCPGAGGGDGWQRERHLEPPHLLHPQRPAALRCVVQRQQTFQPAISGDGHR